MSFISRAFICVIILALPAAAHAYADATQYFPNPTVPNGASYGATTEGIYFTGAPRFASQTCASCHIAAPGRVGLKLGADPIDIFSNGYIPGQVYTFEVILEHESEGLQYKGATCTDAPGTSSGYVQCNNNNFALEVDDAGGAPLGGLFCARAPDAGGDCASADGSEESIVAPSGDVVFGNRPVDPNTTRLELRNGPTSWHLWWTAPRAGSGPVTIYVSAVDGNGGNGTAAIDQDPYGDDVVSAAFVIREAGTAAAADTRASCTIVARPARNAWPPALAIAALALLLLRRRR